MREQIILTILSSSAFSAVVSFLLTHFAQSRARENGIASGVRILLYDRIKHLAKSYISRGSITTEELEDLHSMHEIYHNDLKGNGFLDALMQTANALPIVERESK